MVSWGVGRGWSTDGFSNVYAVSERLVGQEADVVALQQANTLQWPYANEDMVGFLSSQLDMHVHAGLPACQAGDTGNPLFSRFPLLLAQV